MNAADPVRSRLVIQRAVIWPRKKGIPSFVQMGFKNSDANSGYKEQPLFPESYDALEPLCGAGKSGLVFQLDGKHLSYRPIQYAYDQAFKRAGLPYRSTHIMRHGGCRNLFNEVPDPAVAQQLLGNSSMQTTLIYAKRHAGALTQVAEAHWEKRNAEKAIQAEIGS